jgi:hypothetical protein
MLYAKIENGIVVQTKEFEVGAIPEHKQFLWYPVNNVIPEQYDDFYHILSGPTTEISEENKTVSLVYSLEPKPLADLQLLVKEETQRRILEAYPLWKQNSLIIDRFIFSDMKGKPSGPPDLDQKISEINEKLNWIRKIRLKSDTIESMNPIPKDYTNDSYWVV